MLMLRATAPPETYVLPAVCVIPVAETLSRSWMLPADIVTPETVAPA